MIRPRLAGFDSTAETETDPYYFQRVRLDQIQRVTVKRLPPYGSCRFDDSYWTCDHHLDDGTRLAERTGTHRISGWPIAVFVYGFLVPFVAEGRFGLDISFIDERYRWKPPLVVDKASKQKVAEAIQSIVKACEKGGVRISDERKK